MTESFSTSCFNYSPKPPRLRAPTGCLKHHLTTSGRFFIWAVDKDQNRKRVAEGLKEADADFICGLHGCFPDLIRFTLKNLDEADRLDLEKDELTNELVQLSRELGRYYAK